MMEKLLWITLAVVLFAWAMSDSQAATEKDLIPVDIQRVHDDEAKVTCWVIVENNSGKAISCLPNTVIHPDAVNDSK